MEGDNLFYLLTSTVSCVTLTHLLEPCSLDERLGSSGSSSERGWSEPDTGGQVSGHQGRRRTNSSRGKRPSANENRGWEDGYIMGKMP